MEQDADRIIHYLRNSEHSVEELRRVYNDFMRGRWQNGFDRGCDYIRDAMSLQRTRKKHSLGKRFKDVLQVIDDTINTKEDEEK